MQKWENENESTMNYNYILALLLAVAPDVAWDSAIGTKNNENVNISTIMGYKPKPII